MAERLIGLRVVGHPRVELPWSSYSLPVGSASPVHVVDGEYPNIGGTAVLALVAKHPESKETLLCLVRRSSPCCGRAYSGSCAPSA